MKLSDNSLVAEEKQPKRETPLLIGSRKGGEQLPNNCAQYVSYTLISGLPKDKKSQVDLMILLQSC